MICHVQQDWLSHAVHIWLYEESPDGARQLLVDGEGTWRFAHTTPPGARSDTPTLTLPSSAVEALIREASQVMPPSDATSAHLQDTVAVRDRLLAIVERCAAPPTLVDMAGKGTVS